MKPFSYARPTTAADVLKLLSPTARPKAGGNDLLDLAKRGVSTPATLVDLSRISVQEGGPRFDGVTVAEGGQLEIGARVTLAQIAASADVLRIFPALADAAAAAATPQIRNVATLGGNLLQRPRCAYFRDPFFDCLKRGGTSCPARDGVHDEMAIFGNAKCCATHPSNLATALLAAPQAGLATITVEIGAKGGLVWRTVELSDGFFVRPEDDPLIEAAIAPGELLWAAFVPAAPVSAYVEINQKQSYDWASVACAVVLDVEGDKIADARIALGAVAPVPLLSEPAAAALRGKGLRDTAAWDAAAAAATQGATPLARNGHKVRQLRAVVRRAIEAAVARSK
ncbi:MAG: FAD binding domain-containing protein [Planctomycetes bacterium]|nr:FAD binding domain-containing protein [Planctomycetota bacterium]